MFASRKLSSVVFLFSSFVLLAFSQVSLAQNDICYENDFTYDDTQPFFVCHTACVTSVPNTLTCNVPRQNRICNELCSDVRNDMCESYTSQPINLSTGMKHLSQTDYTSSGLFPLTIERNYQSRYNPEAKRFGINWTDGKAGVRVVARNVNGSDIYSIIRPNGTVVKYLGTSNVEAPPLKSDTPESLFIYNSGTFSLEWLLPNGDAYLFVFDRGSFIANGNETANAAFFIKNNGRFHSYQYDTSNRLFTVTDDNGRTLTYAYNSDDRVSSITTPANQVYRYEYDAIGNLQYVYYPDDTPSDATDNPFKTYHYENVDFPYHLTGITDETGTRYSTYTYNAQGKVERSELAGGADRTEVLAYGNQTRITNALGKESVYNYINVGSGSGMRRLLMGIDGEASANCAASNTSYTYDANGYRDTMTDERGYITDYTRDSIGRELSRTEGMTGSPSSPTSTPESRTIATDWHSNSKVEETREADIQRTTTYTGANGNPHVDTITETDLTGFASIPTRTTNYNYTYYRAAERRIQTESVDGPRTDITTDITVTSYDSLGNRTGVTNALGHVMTYSNHDDRGQPRSITDANNIVTHLTYHPRGWLESVTIADPDGNINLDSVTTYTYFDNGLLETVTLPETGVLTYDYDDAQRLRAIENSLGERIEYTLDEAGNRTQTRILNSGGAIVQQVDRAFDELSRIMDVIGSTDNQTTHTDYDVANNPETITNPKALVTTQAFDPLNRVSMITDPDNGETEFTYDNQDRITRVTDANDNITTYTYDGFGNVITRMSPDTGTTHYAYDAADNLTQMTDARGIVTHYSYDALNRLSAITYPANPAENVTYHYDDYSMDSANPDAAETDSYPIGRLTGIDSEYSDIRYYYDHRGNITQQKETLQNALSNVQGSNTVNRTSYSYRLDNQVDTMTYPTGMVVTYRYDTQGRVNQISADYQGEAETSPQTYSIVNNVAYEPFGPVNQIDYGNNTTLTQRYDTDYRLSQVDLTNALSQSLLSQDYSYDLNSNITAIDDLLPADHSYRYTYDNLDRVETDNSDALVAFNNHFRHYDYTYDLVGNRTETRADRHTTYGIEPHTWETDIDPNSNRLGLARLNHVYMDGYEYDATGNIEARTRLYVHPSYEDRYLDSFAYNHAGRLDSSSVVREKTWEERDRTYFYNASFGYNALGQRVYKQSDSGSTTTQRHNEFVYNQQGHLLVDEYTVTVNGVVSGVPLIRQWIYLNGQPIAQISEHQQSSPVVGHAAPFVTWYYTDHLGTTKAGFDDTGALVWDATQSAFAEEFITRGYGSTDIPWNPLRMPGQYYDEETGLFYNWHRYYDPVTGRYITSDPIGLKGGINTYLYVKASPLKYIDPFGLHSSLSSSYSNGFGAFSGTGNGLAHGYNSDISGILDENHPETRLDDPADVLDDFLDPNDRDTCFRLYDRCIQEGWGGSCGTCLQHCRGPNQEWPFDKCSPDICR